MSKTQEKRAARQREQQEFILGRRMQQLAFIKQAFEIGDKLFNDNKDKLSEEETKQIQAMRDEQTAAIAEVEAEIQALVEQLDATNKDA